MIFRLFRKLEKLYFLTVKALYYKLMMGEFGSKSFLYKPLQLDGCKHIYIARNVVVQSYTWLASMPLTDNKHPRLEIREGCVIGHFNHIYCTSGILIGKNVLTADKVYISDNLHGYQNIDLPILKQPIKQLKHIEIGEGAWIGENVSILGASIGQGSVIGANSVVTKDIPAFCVAVGIPARVIKKYNHITKQWEKEF